MHSKTVQYFMWQNNVTKFGFEYNLKCVFVTYNFCGTPYLNVLICFCFHFDINFKHFDWLKESG